MLSVEEKNKIRDTLRTLNLNPDINFAYFLDCILKTKNDMDEIYSKLDRIAYQQRIIDDKLNQIMSMLYSKK